MRCSARTLLPMGWSRRRGEITERRSLGLLEDFSTQPISSFRRLSLRTNSKGGLATWWGTSKRLIAVETEGTQTWAKARAAGEPVDIEVSGLAADSLGARQIGSLGWNALVSSRAESVVVSDQETAAAQVVLATEFGVPSEPAAAAGFAGLLSGKIAVSADEHGVLVICGANSD